MAEPSLKKKSIKGLFWDFSGRIGMQGVGFVVSIVLARLLAPEEFGLLAIIAVFINLASVFLDFGFSTALIQKQDVKEEHYSAVFYLNVVMGFVLATIVFLLAPLIGRFYNKELLVNITRLMSLGIFISAFGNVMRARLRRDMDFKSISLAGIYSSLISGLLALYMAWKGYGVWSLAVQSVVNQLLANVFLYFLCKLRMNFRFSREALKELWPFSSRMFYSGLLDMIFINFDSLLIGKILSPATLGYYYRAKSLENFAFRYTSSTIASVLLPGLSRIQNEPVRLKQTILKIFHLLSFISFLGCGIFLVTSKEIIILLFSAKWEPSVIMFQIIIVGAFAPQIFNLFYNTLLSTGNANAYFTINVINKVFLFLNFSLLFIWGLNAYLISFTGIQIFIFYLGMWLVSKKLNFKTILYYHSFRHILVFMISLGITFTVKHFILSDNLLFLFFSATVSYIICFLILSRTINSDGLKVFSSELTSLIKLYRQRND